MKYMLDTNICIYAIKQEPEVVLQKILKHHPSDICISSITYAELMHGVEKSQSKDKNRLALTLLLSPIQIIDFDSHAAKEYGKIKADLQSQGKIIGPMIYSLLVMQNQRVLLSLLTIQKSLKGLIN